MQTLECTIDFNKPDVHKDLLDMFIKQLEMLRKSTSHKEILEADIEGYKILLNHGPEVFNQFIFVKQGLVTNGSRPSNKDIVNAILEARHE